MALGGRLLARRSLIAGLALLGALLPVCAVAAARATAAAEQVVQRLVDRLWQVLAEQGVGALDEQDLLAVLEEGTDLTLLGRLVLGRYWRDANPRQRTLYLQLFRRYMVQTFVQRLRQYAGNEAGQPGPAFQVIASRPVGNSDILVQSRVLPSGGQPLRVDWRLRERPDGPVVIDLIIEGISLLVTQRSEFAAVLERTGVDGLLTELNARVTQPTQPT
ncbi:MAG TPA: ABC transporter substrate-binding protein [Geminicoccaceae bacterium]|jgi:phospholipid transport system substrate-binding protein|nr:ABC transporter substrate-binding protein [Geminicoccaceae bacterium]